MMRLGEFFRGSLGLYASIQVLLLRRSVLLLPIPPLPASAQCMLAQHLSALWAPQRRRQFVGLTQQRDWKALHHSTKLSRAPLNSEARVRCLAKSTTEMRSWFLKEYCQFAFPTGGQKYQRSTPQERGYLQNAHEVEAARWGKH